MLEAFNGLAAAGGAGILNEVEVPLAGFDSGPVEDWREDRGDGRLTVNDTLAGWLANGLA